MNVVRAASIRRQREHFRGLGQNIAADTSPTCNGTWVVANAQNYSQFGMSKTEYQNTLQWGGVVWGGLLSNVSLTDANGSAFSISNGAIHLYLFPAAGGPQVTLKYDGNTKTLYACAANVPSPLVAPPLSPTPAAAAPNNIPFIIAAVLGVLVVGGIIWAED